jgi:predicted transcriptional regulator
MDTKEKRMLDGYEMYHDHMNRDANILYGIVTKVFEDDILDRSKYRNIVDARKIYSYILRQAGYTYTKIGDFMLKNHATVLHHCNDAPHILKSDSELKEKYLLCRSRYLEAVGHANCVREDSANKQLITSIKHKDKTIQALEEKVKYLELRQDSLNAKIDWYKDEVGFYNPKFKTLYKIITDRTKPDTVTHVSRKLNTMYNGVYSEVIECY